MLIDIGMLLLKVINELDKYLFINIPRQVVAGVYFSI